MTQDDKPQQIINQPIINQPIIIQAEATAEEINKAYYLHRKETELVAPSLTIMIFSSFFAVIFFLFTAVWNIDFLGILSDLLHLFFILFSFAIPVLAVKLYLGYEKSKDFAAGTNALIIPVRYAINQEGVQIVVPTATSFSPWKDVSHAYDCATSIFFVCGGVVCVLPKRDFADAEQLKTVRQIMVDKVPIFRWCKEKRGPIEYLNRYEKSLEENEESETAPAPLTPRADDSKLLVDVQLPEEDSARVVLHCEYAKDELIDTQWRFITKKAVIYQSILQLLFWGILATVIMRQQKLDFEQACLILLLFSPLAVGYVGYNLMSKRKWIADIYGGEYKAQIVITNQSVSFKTSTFEQVLNWEYFVDCFQSAEFFVLYTGGYLILIPKKLLDSQYKKLFVTNLLARKFNNPKLVADSKS